MYFNFDNFIFSLYEKHHDTGKIISFPFFGRIICSFQNIISPS